MWSSFKLLGLKAKLGIIAGIVLFMTVLAGSTYMIGYNKGEAISRMEIAKYEANVWRVVAAAKEIQKQVDVKTVTEYKTSTAYIDRVQYKTNTIVKTVVPEQGNLSNGWIYVYNQSTRGTEPEADPASDATKSPFSDRAALGTITENNAICLSNKAQLDSLQAWIIATETGREEAASK